MLRVTTEQRDVFIGPVLAPLVRFIRIVLLSALAILAIALAN